MFTEIREPISVAGVYHRQTFIPRKFKWRGQSYSVEQITLQSDTRDGGVRQRLYSVMAKGNLYRLTFDRDHETWLLEEVWCE
jgi:hypothetical protein